MYIGIDVGGTCTDAVLLNSGKVCATAKISNVPNNLLSTLECALDEVLKEVEKPQVERVVLSTTVITNLIAEKKQDPVAVIIMPGPGRKLLQYRQSEVHIIQGAIDYRGREIMPLNKEEIVSVIDEIDKKAYNKIAIVGKFSPRNNIHEKMVAEIIKEKKPNWQIELGHIAGGKLNFPRRVANTVLTAATKENYQYFAAAVQEALKKRQIAAPVFIMKADGGTMPLETSLQSPVETIFSGPAASTMGAQALTPGGETSLVVDIGGTTTDLALILSGQPLISDKGVMLGEQFTQVRALSVKSVPVGGDSVVEVVGKECIIYSERMGQPYCLGGMFPTPTDALRVLGLTEIGDSELAWNIMEITGEPAGLSPIEMANDIVNLVVETIVKEINNMFVEWEQEPAYCIWQVINKHKLQTQNIVGVGGGAKGFIPQIASRIGGIPIVPQYAAVANAIGAAVAQATLQINLHADTEQDIFTIEEDGYQSKIRESISSIDDAVELAKTYLINKASYLNINDQLDKIEVTRKDVFNIVRDMVTTGKIYDVCVQSSRGIQWHVGAGGKLL